MNEVGIIGGERRARGREAGDGGRGVDDGVVVGVGEVEKGKEGLEDDAKSGEAHQEADNGEDTGVEGSEGG